MLIYFSIDLEELFQARFRHSKLTILNSLRHKIIHSRWVKGLRRRAIEYEELLL
jgi:hypothetical protein